MTNTALICVRPLFFAWRSWEFVMMVSIGDLDLVADSCLLDLVPFMSVTSDSAVASGLFRGMLRNIDTIVMNRIGCYVTCCFPSLCCISLY